MCSFIGLIWVSQQLSSQQIDMKLQVWRRACYCAIIMDRVRNAKKIFLKLCKTAFNVAAEPCEPFILKCGVTRNY